MFSFLESDGYIQLKADSSISSKDLYSIYRMWCDENGLSPLKARSFSDALVAHVGKYNLEHCNNVTNPAGRRVWGFMGIEAVARPDIYSICGNSLRTYQTNGKSKIPPYVCTQQKAQVFIINKPLPSSCCVHPSGGKANPLEQTLQGQVADWHCEGDHHAGQQQ